MSYLSYLIFSLSSHFHPCLPSLYLLSTSLSHSFLSTPFFPSLSFSTFSFPSLTFFPFFLPSSLFSLIIHHLLFSFSHACLLTLSAFSFPSFFPLILPEVPFPIPSCHIKLYLISMVDCNIPNLFVRDPKYMLFSWIFKCCVDCLQSDGLFISGWKSCGQKRSAGVCG